MKPGCIKKTEMVKQQETITELHKCTKTIPGRSHRGHRRQGELRQAREFPVSTLKKNDTKLKDNKSRTGTTMTWKTVKANLVNSTWDQTPNLLDILIATEYGWEG